MKINDSTLKMLLDKISALELRVSQLESDNTLGRIHRCGYQTTGEPLTEFGYAKTSTTLSTTGTIK